MEKNVQRHGQNGIRVFLLDFPRALALVPAIAGLRPLVSPPGVHINPWQPARI